MPRGVEALWGCRVTSRVRTDTWGWRNITPLSRRNGLMVHRAVGDTGFSVSHCKTGCLIARFTEESSAKAFLLEICDWPERQAISERRDGQFLKSRTLLAAMQHGGAVA